MRPICLLPSKAKMPAGMGLFAGNAIGAHTDVVEYTGEVLNFAQARARRNRLYMKMVSLNVHIDASDAATSSVARFVNDCADASKINCEFVVRDKSRVMVRALRDLAHGEELFVSYGRGHWLFCAETACAGAFLGLALLPGDGGVVATQPLQSKETVCVYSSALWPDDLFYGPEFGCAMHVGDAPNCRLQKNPFLEETVMVITTRAIGAGEALVLPRTSTPPTCVVLTFTPDAGHFTTHIRHRAGYSSVVLCCPARERDDVSCLETLVRALAAPSMPPRVVWLHVGLASRNELVLHAHNFVPLTAKDTSSSQSAPISMRAHDKLGRKRGPTLDIRGLAMALRERNLDVATSSVPSPSLNELLYESLARAHETKAAASWGHDDALGLHISQSVDAAHAAVLVDAVVDGILNMV